MDPVGEESFLRLWSLLDAEIMLYEAGMPISLKAMMILSPFLSP